MAVPPEGQDGASQEGRSRQSSNAGGSGVSSPFQAASTTQQSSDHMTAGVMNANGIDATKPQHVADAPQSDDMIDLPDIFQVIPNDMKINTERDYQGSRQASVPSTSMLPVHSGPPIHIQAHGKSSQPVSSSSSSQSLPTPSQLLKGKQKEGSIPLSPFGHNDMNNSRADKEDSSHTASAMKAFSRPEAADTQISATTSDFQASSGLPSQASGPSMDEDMPSNLGGFSLPSEGLFPTDDSDMADLFGPGSNALFEQLREGMPYWTTS